MIRSQRSPCGQRGNVRQIGKAHRLRSGIEPRNDRVTADGGDLLPEGGEADEVFDRFAPGRLVRRTRPLGKRHQIDHPLVARARGFPPTENPVVHQDHAFDPGEIASANQIGHGFGEDEPRHDVRHHQHPIAEHLPHALGSSGIVRQRNHGIRVGVINEFERQNRVQDRLDARRRSAGISHRRTHLRDHVGVGQRFALAPAAARRRVSRVRSPKVRCGPDRRRCLSRKGCPPRPRKTSARELLPTCFRRREAPGPVPVRAIATCKPAGPVHHGRRILRLHHQSRGSSSSAIQPDTGWNSNPNKRPIER